MNLLLMEHQVRVRVEAYERERKDKQALAPRGGGWNKGNEAVRRGLARVLGNPLKKGLGAIRRGRGRVPGAHPAEARGTAASNGSPPRPHPAHSGFWLSRDVHYPETIDPFWIRW